MESRGSINQFIELHWQVLITKYRAYFIFFFGIRARARARDKILFNGQWQRNPFVRFNGSLCAVFPYAVYGRGPFMCVRQKPYIYDIIPNTHNIQMEHL